MYKGKIRKIIKEEIEKEGYFIDYDFFKSNYDFFNKIINIKDDEKFFNDFEEVLKSLKYNKKYIRYGQTIDIIYYKNYNNIKYTLEYYKEVFGYED